MKVLVIALLLTAPILAQGQSVTIQLTAQDVATIQAIIKSQPSDSRGAKPLTVQEWVSLWIRSSLSTSRGRSVSPGNCAGLTDATRKELISKKLCN
jgi:hypothetical protein